MGTFILRPVSVSSPNTGWEVIIGGVPDLTPSNAELVQAAASDLDPMADTGLRITGIGSGAVGFSCIGLGLYLDGSLTPIDTNNLPLGFTVINARFQAVSVFNAPGSGKSITYRRDGSILHVSADDETVDIDLGSLTNVGLIGSILNVAGETSDGSNIACNDIGISGVYTTDQITLFPSGGDVEPGQTVIAGGSNVQNFQYAATQGDNVIPLNVKNNPNGTVTLEIPYPPTDDCTVALTACPECEECFAECNADLDSEACAECMAACLECLEGELEDIDTAEACNESSRTPPEVDIIIICSDPHGSFEGSVPLGNFTIIVANGSGLYRFVNGKTNDTLYTAARDGTTYDVKIPNPFGKTGFFRS